MSKNKTPIHKSDLVKIRLVDGQNSERVWAEVLDIMVKVRIDNEPVATPFELDEEVTIPISYILDKYKKETTK